MTTQEITERLIIARQVDPNGEKMGDAQACRRLTTAAEAFWARLG